MMTVKEHLEIADRILQKKNTTWEQAQGRSLRILAHVELAKLKMALGEEYDS